ncbi:hypothetical protein HQ529_02465 [Candidatus Woesearchaeota archaeon]|nr:hypothetical protein [Candidatus Woesearchaeota archaeon]
MNKKSKNKGEIYCIYCGENKSSGHSEECSLVTKTIPEEFDFLRPVKGNTEHNLSLKRTVMLITQRYEGEKAFIGPKNKKIYKRVFYEQMAWTVRVWTLGMKLLEDKRNKFNSFFIDWKLKRLDKKCRKGIEALTELGNFSEKDVNDLLLHEKVISHKPIDTDVIPVWRNEKTKELFYSIID